ncbi:hypothetical protein XENTR_v10023354 [Xenopus tropicalis]|uniref:Up-regulator of cell proliferation n=1 Tax=Xenopus tropicalis TaxID=8364 RepID=A0A803JLZ8_XENTR|nr:up-regulator of cell proliferation [Xenopus tropicalis]KAE8578143.1 hypothetical protein XENTR_v10023354 [Xenopus tropicalis]
MESKGEENIHELIQMMKKYNTSKLSLRNILDIGQENVTDIAPTVTEDLPLTFLRKLVALDSTARSIEIKEKEPKSETRKPSSQPTPLQQCDSDDEDKSNSINPLDVLCVLLQCSDMFLQQNIFSKMSLCQFAVPLLLPAGDGPECTFMLWALRDIVKRWRPQLLAESKGFIEKNLVQVPMHFFSFVKLGKRKLSKSKILNQVLSQTQQNHNFFLHDDMEGGNIERQISNGLVEVHWYLPVGNKNSDIFPEPVAVTNLRGDIESHWMQFSFLTQVSSAVFVFAESINEIEFELFSKLKNSTTTFNFIITSRGKSTDQKTSQMLQELSLLLKINKSNILRVGKGDNNTEMVKKLRQRITDFMSASKKTKLENMLHTALELGIKVDEMSGECQKAKICAYEITKHITDVVKYRKKTFKLQGDLWKQIARVEKELCRMKEQGDTGTEQYKSQLIQRRTELHREQNKHKLPDGMIKFISAITDLSLKEKQYFLKLIQFTLDSLARDNLSLQQTKYKEKCKDSKTNQTGLKHLDQQMSDSSLGVEHFLREMGQFYEAECSMIKEKQINAKEKKFTKLPGIAADLLLGGFPLELIDGDASNIPMVWVTDILTELDKKTGGKCRMRVITVLGVQSTGKSTLLNTMFGLQFPVASGRCTRGAFMTLIKVKENLQKDLGCEFVLVIDTEGLKASELASLEGSYEHDNELATLVVGLSDITIVNIAMENAEEMKDTLQIVVHAFLRMSHIGKKPKCQFVHQNVSDVSAHQMNMMSRTKLLKQLDNMTKAAANMEKKSGITSFCDIMDYNIEEDNWFIAGLWYGVPPMASVSSGYSENVYELKKYLIQYMKESRDRQNLQSIKTFIKWTKSLWNAVKYEKFLFSFRNSLVADAYNNLSVKYSQWEWNFRKKVYTWLIEAETTIKNESANNLLSETGSRFDDDLLVILSKEEENMLNLLKEYFKEKSNHVELIIKYKEDFFRGVPCLRKNLQHYVTVKLGEAVKIQNGKLKIQAIQRGYQMKIENEVTNLLESVKREKRRLSNKEVTNAFETMWKRTLAEVPRNLLEKRNVSEEMIQKLKKDQANKASYINERLLKVRHLEEFGKNEFTIRENPSDTKENTFSKITEFWRKQSSQKLRDFAFSIITKCNRYVNEKVKTEVDYNDMYCQELLNIINEKLGEKEYASLHSTHQFELDLKLHILGNAAPRFQRMHNAFNQQNDPVLCLEKLKSDYLATFVNIFQEKDETQNRAKRFCELCLKPAITDHINQHLGKDIVDDIVHSGNTKEYCSRTFFQFTVLKKLLEENTFSQYVQYIKSYESFVKTWIVNYITDRYNHSQFLKDLQVSILTGVCGDIRKGFNDLKSSKMSSIQDLLKRFCEELKTKLVISEKNVKVIVFHNTADIQQFSKDIEVFLMDTEEQILSEIKSSCTESVLAKLTVKPEEELFKRVFGCGKQCPFCGAPCEAGGTDHKEHFASVHQPQGLGRCRNLYSHILETEICSTDVVTEKAFRNADTDEQWHPYKEYRTIYPDWAIQPDPSITASDYWKYVFVKFNEEFAEEYEAKPADLPETWLQITEEQALQSLQETFHMK